MPAHTHPPDLPGGVADHKRVIGHIVRDDTARANQCIAPHRMAAHNGGIGPNGCPFPQQCLLKFRFPFYKTPGIQHIRKHRRGTQS